MPIKEIVETILSIFKSRPFKVMSRQKILLGAALLLGLSLLLYQSLLAPQLMRSKIMGRCLLAQKRLAAYQQRIIKDPQILLSKIDQMKDRLKNLEKRFIKAQELPQTWDDLKNLIGKTENYLFALDIKPAVSVGSYEKLPFSLTVKGYYVDTILLLNKLEGYPRLIDIKDIKIQPSAERPYDVLMSLVAELFVVKD